MASNGGRRSSAPGNNSSLILGILIGMVVGLAIAGAVAWHISKRPSTFSSKDPHEVPAVASAVPESPKAKPAAAAVQPANAQPASAVANGKPRFEFYTVLTDKEGAAPKGAGHTPAPSSAQKETPRPSAPTGYFLQAGSFTAPDEADRLKAKLALLGMEASVQKADIPGKGMHYRVRLGPYASADELNKANGALKQNGITDAAPVHGQ